MITYVDTSAFLKLVVTEPGSAETEVIWDQADELAVARIGHVEGRAALAAARRGRRLTSGQYRKAVEGVELLWEQMSIIEITPELIQTAAGLAEEQGLRGYDAVHLAAAVLIGADVMASADLDLCRAAESVGLHVANLIASDG